MNLPNRLTLARIGLTALFVMAMLLPAQGIVRSHLPLGKTVALVLFIVASLTDWLDGRIARRQKLETSFGALLDPVADKVLTTAAFICFIEQKDQHGNALVQAWMVLVIVARDFLVMGLRLVAREQGMVLKAERLGKQKTASQMIAIVATLLGLAAREDWNCFGVERQSFDAAFSEAVFWMMLITVALTLLSGITYLVKNHSIFMHDA